MIYTERLLKLVKVPYISEKSSIKMEKYNTIVLKVFKYSTKSDIKNAVFMLFSVEVIKVNVLTTSKKSKRSRCNYKKAYVFLKPGSKIDLTNKIK